MCGRYTLATPSPGDVRARFPIAEDVEVRRRFNIAPGDDVLAVTTDREGTPRGELLHWGLVPSWADVGGRDANPRLKMINARIETVAERPAFRRPFGRFRCLVVADGFYEWRTDPAPRRVGSAKQAFHITPPQAGAAGTPFAFAGLWSIWKDPEGRRLRSCAILTQPADESMAALHDRMPVILAPETEAAWLDPATPRTELLELLRASDGVPLSLRAVGPAVNDARYDGPECLAPPPDTPAPATLF